LAIFMDIGLCMDSREHVDWFYQIIFWQERKVAGVGVSDYGGWGGVYFFPAFYKPARKKTHKYYTATFSALENARI